PVDLGEHPRAISGMQQRILRPGVVELRAIERNGLEARVMDADELLEPRSAAELPIALVLRLTQIHAGDAAARVPREPARRAPVARAGVDHPAVAAEAPQATSHRRDRTLRSGGD